MKLFSVILVPLVTGKLRFRMSELKSPDDTLSVELVEKFDSYKYGQSNANGEVITTPDDDTIKLMTCMQKAFMASQPGGKSKEKTRLPRSYPEVNSDSVK